MLGFPSHNEPIKEPYASQIREKLVRYSKGEYTEEEKAFMDKMKKISKQYKAVWYDGDKVIYKN